MASENEVAKSSPTTDGARQSTSSDKLSKKDKIAVRLDLAKLTQTDFISRRDLEWKLSLGFWGSIAAFVYVIVDNPSIHTVVASIGTGCLLISAFAFHLLVMGLIQVAHAHDSKLYWEHRNAIDKRDPPNWKRARQILWLFYHVGITALVLIGAWIMLQAAATVELSKPNPKLVKQNLNKS